MRAIMVMFDSLGKRMLPIYGNDNVIAENFQRLEEKTNVFTNFYAGSMPWPDQYVRPQPWGVCWILWTNMTCGRTPSDGEGQAEKRRCP